MNSSCGGGVNQQQAELHFAQFNVLSLENAVNVLTFDFSR